MENSVVKQLAKEIQSKKRIRKCSKCKGKGEHISEIWSSFTKKYGEDSLDDEDNKYRKMQLKFIANIGWSLSNMDSSEITKRILDTSDFNQVEATDIATIVLAPSKIQKCVICNGKGIIETEFGKQLSILKEALSS